MNEEARPDPKNIVWDAPNPENIEWDAPEPIVKAEKPKSILRKGVEAVGGLAKDITEPAIKTLAVWPLQGVASIARSLGSMSAGQGYNDPEMSKPTKVPFYGEIHPSKGLNESLGEAMKTGALVTGSAPAAGALFMGGESIGKGGTPNQVAMATMGGALLGKGGDVLGAELKKIVSGKAGQAIGGQLKEGAGRVVNSLIKPLLKDFSYGKNPGMTVAKINIVANSLDELAANILKARNDIGNKIQSILSSPENMKKSLNINPAIKPIDDAMELAAKKNNHTVISRLAEVRKALMENLTLSTDNAGNPIIVSTGKRNLANMTPKEATALKTFIGDMTRWTGNASDDQAVNKALKQTYGGIKEQINKTVPGIGALNEDYAGLTSAHIATVYRDKIAQRHNLLGLAPKIIGGGGILAAAYTKSPEILIASLAELGLDKFLASPYAKTRLASVMYNMSLADRIVIFSKFPKIKNSINSILVKANATSGKSSKLALEDKSVVHIPEILDKAPEQKALTQDELNFLPDLRSGIEKEKADVINIPPTMQNMLPHRTSSVLEPGQPIEGKWWTARGGTSESGKPISKGAKELRTTPESKQKKQIVKGKKKR